MSEATPKSIEQLRGPDERPATGRSLNPFREPTQNIGGLVHAETHKAIAEIQAMMVIAKQFPRNQKNAMDRILQECTRPGLAEKATYSYARGGTDITGPTIRIAETISREWGNFESGIKELSQGEGYSEVMAYAWDIETNRRESITFQVPHTRQARGSVTKLTDPRDIYEHIANQAARRKRACILALIPGDVIDAAMDQCELTLKTKVDITPDALKLMLDKFSAFGVTKEMIEDRIQRRLDAITPALFVSLRKIYNSLSDGMSKPEEWFKPAQTDAQTVQQQTGETYSGKPSTKPAPERKRQTKAATPEKPVTQQSPVTKPAPAQPPVKPATVIPDARPGEQVPQTAGPTFKELNDMITLADESDDDLDTLLDLCSGFKGPYYSRLMELLARKYGVKRLAERGGNISEVATKEDPSPTTGTFPGLE
jgi:hypothetical protein